MRMSGHGSLYVYSVYYYRLPYAKYHLYGLMMSMSGYGSLYVYSVYWYSLANVALDWTGIYTYQYK